MRGLLDQVQNCKGQKEGLDAVIALKDSVNEDLIKEVEQLKSRLEGTEAKLREYKVKYRCRTVQQGMLPHETDHLSFKLDYTIEKFPATEDGHIKVPMTIPAFWGDGKISEVEITCSKDSVMKADKKVVREPGMSAEEYLVQVGLHMPELYHDALQRGFAVAVILKEPDLWIENESDSDSNCDDPA